MTKKVFWENPYLTTLDTYITGINGSDVTVAATILYAFSGGQESDTGIINGWTVRQARKDGLEIVYTLDDHHDLRVGDPVRMVLDWERRYRLMRLHFAAELVLELTYRTLNSVQKIGAHIAHDKSRIDFEWNDNITAIFPALKEQTRTLIAANHPIISAFSDEVNERRYWEIVGFARVACGGTHLRTTGEVRELELKRKNIGKGKERIEIYVTD
ncbi:MAG: alanyl-tRNA editing protein [Anaerolineaceae bacterium]|nr:alanyl-tRNA editing protein [Anaerolineaceae bacterium]